MPRPGANCTLVIGGAFDPKWSGYVEGLAQEVEVEGGIIRSTTLLAHPADLAEFIGLLNMFADFHIPLIACEFREAEIPLDHSSL